jgi:hypothetical protein
MPLKVLKVAFFVYRLVVAWCTKVQHLKCLRIFNGVLEFYFHNFFKIIDNRLLL